MSSANLALNNAEIPKFEGSKSALNQRWFSPKQSWLRAVSALIFSETELKSADFLWNGADNRWSLLKQRLSVLIFAETTLNIPEFCVFQFLSSPVFFAIFLQGNLDITLSGYLYLIASRQKLDLSFFTGKLRS